MANTIFYIILSIIFLVFCYSFCNLIAEYKQHKKVMESDKKWYNLLNKKN